MLASSHTKSAPRAPSSFRSCRSSFGLVAKAMITRPVEKRN
nr:MAG TPA: hypothetical protein [Caudoviricetes sp.]